jgi:hypothetical protein
MFFLNCILPFREGGHGRDECWKFPKVFYVMMKQNAMVPTLLAGK